MVGAAGLEPATLGLEIKIRGFILYKLEELDKTSARPDVVMRGEMRSEFHKLSQVWFTERWQESLQDFWAACCGNS